MGRPIGAVANPASCSALSSASMLGVVDPRMFQFSSEAGIVGHYELADSSCSVGENQSVKRVLERAQHALGIL